MRETRSERQLIFVDFGIAKTGLQYRVSNCEDFSCEDKRKMLSINDPFVITYDEYQDFFKESIKKFTIIFFCKVNGNINNKVFYFKEKEEVIDFLKTFEFYIDIDYAKDRILSLEKEIKELNNNYRLEETI